MLLDAKVRAITQGKFQSFLELQGWAQERLTHRAGRNGEGWASLAALSGCSVTLAAEMPTGWLEGHLNTLKA